MLIVWQPRVNRAMSDQYQGLYHTFQWLVPTHFNIAQMCCQQWAANPSDARRVALYAHNAAGEPDTWSYARLGAAANQLANGLTRMGVKQGDRVAVILGQRAETVVAHMAIYTLGAIVVPLSPQAAPGMLSVRLRDAQARIAIVDSACVGQTMDALEAITTLQQIISIDFHNERTIAWRSLLARQPVDFRAPRTRASDPALLLYTNGGANPPKGVVLTHAALIGNLPGFVATHNWFPRNDDVFWTPADWASSAGLMNALLPTLYFGRPIVATPCSYTPEHAWSLIQRHNVRCVFFTAAALGDLKQAVADPRAQYRLPLRSIAVSGAPLDPALFDWCRTALGVTPNETYGLTEANHIIGNSHGKWPAQPGSMGRPIPGHKVAILDDQGLPLSVGEVGEIAVGRTDIHGEPDPVLYHSYWHCDAATQACAHGNWFRTGDLAWRDENGDFWYVGRKPVARATAPTRRPSAPTIRP